MVNPSGLTDGVKCFAFVRQRRWPQGVRRPGCDGAAVVCGGISQHKLPSCLGLFQLMRDARHRGKALFDVLTAALLA